MAHIECGYTNMGSNQVILDCGRSSINELLAADTGMAHLHLVMIFVITILFLSNLVLWAIVLRQRKNKV